MYISLINITILHSFTIIFKTQKMNLFIWVVESAINAEVYYDNWVNFS